MKNKGILIFLLLLIIINTIVLIVLGNSLLKEIILNFIGIFIGITGFSMKDVIKENHERRISLESYKKTLGNFNSLVGKSIGKEFLMPKQVAGNLNEEEILDDILTKGIERLELDLRNSLKLIFFCKKWEKSKSSRDFNYLEKIFKSMDIDYLNPNRATKILSDLYNKTILMNQGVNLSSIGNIEREEALKLLKSFISRYYKDLKILELREKFDKNKELHLTLIEIIKEGKLSTYGITNETLNKLRLEINKNHSSAFLILVNNTTPQDRAKVRAYFHKYPRFGTSARGSKMPISQMFAMYIIKTKPNMDPKKLLKDFLLNVSLSSEALVDIIPLRLNDHMTYTFPLDKRFSNSHIREGHKLLEWFVSGETEQDSSVWSEITKASITSNQLLALIPFNIFCKDILPCERTFIIKNYPKIRTNFEVNTLEDWSSKNSSLLGRFMLSLGFPNYSLEEKQSVLKIDNPNEEKDKIKNRFLELSKQIIHGSKEYTKSLRPLNLE